MTNQTDKRVMDNLNLLDEIRAIAQLGLNYSKDPYDLERYHRLLALASSEYSVITGLQPDEIKERFSQELGYITPKVGVQGVLINEAGQILLELRKDDNLWGLPSGWVEVGETPEEAIIREFKEETNLSVQPLKMLGLYSRKPGEYNQPHSSIHLLYYCLFISGELAISHESSAMRFCSIREIDNWHKDHLEQAKKGIEFWKSKQKSL